MKKYDRKVSNLSIKFEGALVDRATITMVNKKGLISNASYYDMGTEDKPETFCDCQGFTARGDCRHIKALREIVSLNKSFVFDDQKGWI